MGEDYRGMIASRQQQGQQATQQATSTPTPTPAASGGGIAGAPGALGGSSLSTPVVTPGVSGATTAGTTPPPDFVKMVKAQILSKLGGPTSAGYTKQAAIPSADVDSLIARLWSDTNIQSDYYNAEPVLQAGPSNQFYPNTFNSLNAQLNTALNTGTTTDPTIPAAYLSMVQGAGVILTTAEQNAMATAGAALNAPVPQPFQPAAISGYRFGDPMPAGGWTGNGQSYGWPVHMGTDYGTPAGSRIVSPFAGTVEVKTGVEGYGNQVLVHLDNGWTIGFGHVANASLQSGQRVNPGDLIAISGANVGSARGAVTLVTWQNAQHQFVDPATILNPIFGGTTFSAMGPNFQGAAGIGTPSVNAALDREYPGIKADWTNLFGSPPSPEDVTNVLAHGTSPQQWTDYMRSLPSHIPGLPSGQYSDLRTMADQTSQKLLGHAATDGIVQELQQQGMTDPNGVTLFYNNLRSQYQLDDMEHYKPIAAEVQKVNANIYNDPGADPRVVQNIAFRNMHEKTS